MKKKIKSVLQSAFTSDMTEAGLDEAGRGCLAGPVVAAAVILPKDYVNSKLNDSKQLSARQRNVLRKEIEQESIAFSIAEVDNLKIDEINILQASFLAMHKAVENLAVVPELLLIDGHLFKAYPLIQHICVVKGDSKYLSIAAASVLAKTYRDELMCNLAKEFPEYGWESNFAYPTLQHRKAIDEKGLTKYHRLTFKHSPINSA
jgi:ribonuclease HII